MTTTWREYGMSDGFDMILRMSRRYESMTNVTFLRAALDMVSLVIPWDCGKFKGDHISYIQV